MAFEESYRLQVSMTIPEIVEIDEEYETTYHIKNINEINFPGGQVVIVMYWPSLGTFLGVSHVMDVKALAPLQIQDFPFHDKPASSGMTMYRPHGFFFANDGIPIKLFFPDGVEISEYKILGSFRVKSKEETLQEELIQVLERSIISQNRLANSQLCLTILGVVIALFQFVSMFVIPYLPKAG